MITLAVLNFMYLWTRIKGQFLYYWRKALKICSMKNVFHLFKLHLYFVKTQKVVESDKHNAPNQESIWPSVKLLCYFQINVYHTSYYVFLNCAWCTVLIVQSFVMSWGRLQRNTSSLNYQAPGLQPSFAAALQMLLWANMGNMLVGPKLYFSLLSYLHRKQFYLQPFGMLKKTNLPNPKKGKRGHRMLETWLENENIVLYLFMCTIWVLHYGISCCIIWHIGWQRNLEDRSLCSVW